MEKPGFLEISETKVLKGKKKKTSPGQTKLPWATWEADNPEIEAVAEKFVMANCYDAKIAMQLFL
jgi:putative transposase